MKTLKDIQHTVRADGLKCEPFIPDIQELKQAAIKTFENLQGPDSISGYLLRDFPDDCKGSIAKKMWNDTEFRYGAEYGMLSMLWYFFNLTKENIYGDEGGKD